MNNGDPQVIVVAGQTASGKSDFAVALAQKCNGEIISADSRQVYKVLDIGTGKITKEEMKGIPHHMLSVYALGEDVSVATYARDAKPILEDILARGKTPIICGGTGQYIDALIFDTAMPPVPPNKELRAELEKLTTEELVAMLSQADPTRMAAIDPHNRVRLIRALEIIDELGTVPAQSQPKLLYSTKFYLMNPTREVLRERVTKRLENRLAIGMIDEVKNIMAQGYTSEGMKKFGLEYETIGKYLEETLSGEEMKQELITATMQYAKRQQTWNKKYEAQAELIDIKA